MLFDAGILAIYELINTAEPGRKPAEQLRYVSQHFYGERNIGYGRQYAARGVNEQVDLLARIWEDRGIRVGMYAATEGGDQYRIDNVQHLTGEDGLKVTDLTLSRLEKLYDVAD